MASAVSNKMIGFMLILFGLPWWEGITPPPEDLGGYL
jgi:hypothetical protein